MNKKLRILKYKIQYFDLKYPYVKVVILLALVIGLLVGTDLIIETLSRIIAFLIAVIFHEVAHGYVAYFFGDDTAKIEGRLSLNPLKHISLEGILLPALLLIFKSPIIIGSAKPVPVNYNKLKNKKMGIFFVSIAGILANLLIAFIAGLIFRNVSNYYIQIITINIFVINVSIAAFNILPIPPLDGSRVLRLLLPYRFKIYLDRIEASPFLGFILIILILNTSILQYIYLFLIRLVYIWM